MTLADLLARTRECGDCLEWTDAIHSVHKAPVFTRRDRKVYARREAALLSGRQIAGRCVTSTCKNPLCINPDHLRVVSRSVIQRRTAASGAFSGLNIKVKVAAAKRATSKLSQDDVREIRRSCESVAEKAHRFGISQTYVYMILNNQSRIDYVTPFLGILTHQVKGVSA